jgi:hypothetical protein
LLLETPVARKYLGVMDSGESTHAGLGLPPQAATAFKEEINNAKVLMIIVVYTGMRSMLIKAFRMNMQA